MYRIKTYPLTILAGIGILIAVLMPGSDVPKVTIPYLDKVVHFTMFGVLTVCYYWDYHRTYCKLPLFLKTSIQLVLFGALTEVLQSFTADRSCDMKDLVADLLGVLIISILINKYNQSKKKS